MIYLRETYLFSCATMLCLLLAHQTHAPDSYIENIFIYAMLAIMLLTLIVLLLRGPDRWKKKKVEKDFYGM